MERSERSRWSEIESALEAVLEAETDERPAVLERVCGADDELRREVESLLGAHARSRGVLDTTAQAFAAPYLARALANGEGPGVVIGRYRLVEEIGRGGMGTVWLAERADGQFEQRVALKLVKRGMDSDEIVTRFYRERQILARLEHPNIARLLDGGVSDDGRPYFVMEHVAGLPITDHCDRNRAPIDERLRLFAVVCRTVQHAHRNLVVHRDLKPSNVLVDDGGRVKLLDFGIAKLLAEEGDLSRTMARTGGGFWTPEYASPEQVLDETVTTASDVYQLGLLLYELLTGHRPYATRDRTPAEVRRAILEATPQRPSTAVRRSTAVAHRDGTTEMIEPRTVGERRSTNPERLRRRLRGDLDAIALRALRKEPERRYPSAEALAEDVERHLADLPIRYGGDRLAYRGSKFVRRHRVAVASAATIAAAITALGALDFARVRAERDRARLEADKATEVAQLMGRFVQGWSPEAADREEISSETMLREAASRAESELRDRPEILAASLSLLGDLQTSIGAWGAADSLLARALSIQERLYREPNSDLAATLARRGRYHVHRTEHHEAEPYLRRALEIHRAVSGPRHAETLRVQLDLANVLREWGGKLAFGESEALLRDVLRSLEEVGREDSPFALETSTHLGYVLFQQGRYDEAVALLAPTLEKQRAMLGPSYPVLYTTQTLASVLRDRGDLEGAEAHYREAVRIARTFYGDDRWETAIARYTLSLLLVRTGELEEAEILARESTEAAAVRYGREHPVTWGRWTHLGSIRLDRGDPAEAEALLRDALAVARRTSSPDDPDLGDVLNRLAYLLVDRGAADAGTVYREAIRFQRARPAESPVFVTDGLHFLAAAEHRMGDRGPAEADYRRALGVYRRLLPTGHRYRAAAATGLGAVLLERNRPAEAERYLREGLAQWAAHDPPEPQRITETRALLDRARSARGRP